MPVCTTGDHLSSLHVASQTYAFGSAALLLCFPCGTTFACERGDSRLNSLNQRVLVSLHVRMRLRVYSSVYTIHFHVGDTYYIPELHYRTQNLGRIPGNSAGLEAETLTPPCPWGSRKINPENPEVCRTLDSRVLGLRLDGQTLPPVAKVGDRMMQVNSAFGNSDSLLEECPGLRFSRWSVAGLRVFRGCTLGYTIGASIIITYSFSIMGPKTLFELLRPLHYSTVIVTLIETF